MVNQYTPKRGDLIWLDFDPQAGHEQAGRRPALVLSAYSYNTKTKRCLACPITSKIKGYPFEVLLPAGLPIQGAVLADHIKNLDWVARRVGFIGTVQETILENTLTLIEALARGH
jgi:mRNA interferase MazF